MLLSYLCKSISVHPHRHFQTPPWAPYSLVGAPYSAPCRIAAAISSFSVNSDDINRPSIIACIDIPIAAPRKLLYT